MIPFSSVKPELFGGGCSGVINQDEADFISRECFCTGADFGLSCTNEDDAAEETDQGFSDFSALQKGQITDRIF